MSPLQQGGRQQKGANSSFSHLRLCAGPPWPGWYPPTLESSLPAEGTDSNARLLQEHRHRHTQKCLIWAPCGQSELTIRNDFKTVNVLLQNFSSPSLCQRSRMQTVSILVLSLLKNLYISVIYVSVFSIRLLVLESYFNNNNNRNSYNLMIAQQEPGLHALLND